jgi:hypothetical protein
MIADTIGKREPANGPRREPRLGMIELIIEHWKNLDGSSQYLWSVWRDGKRLGVSRPTASPQDAEEQGLDWCQKSIGGQPDRVTRL